ncbi:MAG: hypothetical protein AAF658_03475 [Myxococcota bacterium]
MSRGFALAVSLRRFFVVAVDRLAVAFRVVLEVRVVFAALLLVDLLGVLLLERADTFLRVAM